MPSIWGGFQRQLPGEDCAVATQRSVSQNIADLVCRRGRTVGVSSDRSLSKRFPSTSWNPLGGGPSAGADSRDGPTGLRTKVVGGGEGGGLGEELRLRRRAIPLELVGGTGVAARA